MTYAEAVHHLYGLAPELARAPGTLPRRFDLTDMRRLAAALGNPQNRVSSILIAGTNGKGSTAATLAAILTAAGYRTGLYTSPHLIRVNERIQLAHPVLPSEYGTTLPGTGGPLTLTEIPDADFARHYTDVDAAGKALVHTGELPLEPSFFERLTASAFLYYADQQADLMVLEVGLGGRLDATNIVEPLLAILTDISLDHQEYLGHTIAEIATEKCGILRRNGTLITLPQLPEANHAIGLAATALEVRAINAAQYIPAPTRATDAPMQRQPRSFDLSSEPPLTSRGPALSSTLHDHYGHRAQPAVPEPPRNRYTVTLPDRSQLNVDSPLAGTHQQRNIALAIAAAIEISNNSPYNSIQVGNTSSYTLDKPAIEAGILNTRWPGRLEFLPPNLLLDVAHNPAGAWTLRSALATLDPAQPRTLIFSCLRDKSLSEMARILFPLFDSSADADPLRRHDHILLAPIASPRAAAVDDLLAAAHTLNIPAHAAPHLIGALQQARQITPQGGIIVATGSVYLVGEIRELALKASGA